MSASDPLDGHHQLRPLYPFFATSVAGLTWRGCAVLRLPVEAPALPPVLLGGPRSGCLVQRPRLSGALLQRSWAASLLVHRFRLRPARASPTQLRAEFLLRSPTAPVASGVAAQRRWIWPSWPPGRLDWLLAKRGPRSWTSAAVWCSLSRPGGVVSPLRRYRPCSSRGPADRLGLRGLTNP